MCCVYLCVCVCVRVCVCVCVYFYIYLISLTIDISAAPRVPRGNKNLVLCSILTVHRDVSVLVCVYVSRVN